jgi:hypothetical protein
MFSDFMAALRTGAEPAMTLAMARRDLALLEAIAAADAGDMGRTD